MIRSLTLLGPAFIAAVAYVDPGNVAVNITAGSQFGYTLVWVVVLANAMAVVVQYLSAKLGIVTSTSLSGHVARVSGRKSRFMFWLQAEAIAIATDMAEIVGGAIALNLIFDVPLVVGALITTAVSMSILTIGDRRGPRALERVIITFLALIGAGFTAGLWFDPPQAADIASGLWVQFDGSDSVLLASAIIGATVMPHVIYLHSSLMTNHGRENGRNTSTGDLITATKIDVTLALVVAGFLNLSLLVLAANFLFGQEGTETLNGVHELVSVELGAGIALLFAVALLSSGLASTSVGCAAGAEVMGSLLTIQVPLFVRRIVTVIPALAVLILGVEPSYVLVISQVVLSLGIPFALIPLIVFTSQASLMGEHVNRLWLRIIASLIAAVVLVLNLALLILTFF